MDGAAGITAFKGRRVLVAGLKRSGRAAALALFNLGARVSVTDMKTAGELGACAKDLPAGIGLYLGGHPEEALEGVELVVASPGVPMDAGLLKTAAGRGIEIMGELELGYRLFKYENPLVDFLAVTGTNGKSTTCTLLHSMLRKAGRNAVLAGNIGEALTGFFAVKEAREADTVVVEVSSFQLEAVSDFKPRVAAILNLAPDHLDRYAGLEAYYGAKMKIYRRQDEGDFLVLNAADPVCRRIAGRLAGAPGIVYFGSGEKARERTRPGLYERDGSVFVNLPGLDAELIKTSEIRIKGAHNLENAMAAGCMALLAGAPVQAVRGALMEFPGLAHRMEFVREIEGVVYVNDSKGTNPPAVLRSLQSFGASPLVLIAGGRDKNGDFESLRGAVKDHVRLIVLIGEAAGKMEAALRGAAEIRFARDMEEAVRTSRQAARPGDVVLLSPACASFDMFEDFEDRGRKFNREVWKL
ncbi:MAG: UDP-N-acetylmuramoyl-L-alanine--D-glutamate ligase [Nitrospiraceae bacterium]|nr:UDP-N-acetylmuramoyl-L-alanine--D-glutamate ligase [Nitrospiraceae bacterium]